MTKIYRISSFRVIFYLHVATLKKLSFPSHARQMHFGIAVLQRAWVHTVCVAARYTQSAGNVAKGICIKAWQTHDFGWKTFAFRAIPNTKLIIWSQGLSMVVGTLGKRRLNAYQHIYENKQNPPNTLLPPYICSLVFLIMRGYKMLWVPYSVVYKPTYYSRLLTSITCCILLEINASISS